MAVKTLVDYILEEDYDRYNELLDMAEAAKEEYKKAHPVEKKPRGPQTLAQKQEAAKKRLEKAQAALAALLAQQDEAAE
jgi:hypothetical protein